MDMHAIAILISGGLDSAILLGDAMRTYKMVHPLYVRNGLVWEDVEQDHLRRFLDAVHCPALRPLQVLNLPASDLFPGHWSLNGQGVPGIDSPDEAVLIPARNVLLLAKAILWCHLRKVPAVALGTLGSNPFADATPAFFGAFQTAVNLAVGGSVQVRRPYAELTKLDVMHLGRGLPLQLTFSCIHPIDGRHCGACNKCQERRLAFRDAGMDDPTEYQDRS